MGGVEGEEGAGGRGDGLGGREEGGRWRPRRTPTTTTLSLLSLLPAAPTTCWTGCRPWRRPRGRQRRPGPKEEEKRPRGWRARGATPSNARPAAMNEHQTRPHALVGGIRVAEAVSTAVVATMAKLAQRAVQCWPTRAATAAAVRPVWQTLLMVRHGGGFEGGRARGRHAATAQWRGCGAHGPRGARRHAAAAQPPPNTRESGRWRGLGAKRHPPRRAAPRRPRRA